MTPQTWNIHRFKIFNDIITNGWLVLGKRSPITCKIKKKVQALWLYKKKKKNSHSAQLRLKFILFINVQMPTFISRINYRL